MKLRIKKKKEEKINEEDITTSSVTDPSLVSQLQQLQNDKKRIQEEFNKEQENFNNIQEKFNNDMKVIDDKIALITQKQETINAQAQAEKNQQGEQNTNESIKHNKQLKRIFESETKKNLLVDAITNILVDNKEDFSYDLSKDEIRRVARKINDYLTEHKNEDIVWEDVRYVIKNYLIKHNTISFSQSEINLLNDLLEDYLIDNEEYKEFSKYF